MNRRVTLLLPTMLISILLLSGCGGEQFAYQPAQEIKPGPGLLSGKDGEFTLLGKPRTEEDTTDSGQGEQKKQ